MTARWTRVGLLAIAAAVAIAFIVTHPPHRLDRDLNAFYCGAKILSQGGDPYRFRSLYECQTHNMPPIAKNVAVPPALPPYALALFIPLAKLPFAQADVVWNLLVAVGVVVVAMVVVDLSGLPPLLVAACLFPAVLLQSFTNSGLAPIPIALLAGAALALHRQKATLAAVLLGAAAIEPNVTLPPIIVVALMVPWMRLRLAAVAVAGLLLSLATGVELNREYFLTVLPAHASSELGTAIQYSLSSTLYALGLSERLSLLLGTLQYASFIAIGWWLAKKLGSYTIAVAVLAPMACAVVGGTFLHLSQIWGFLPFALCVAAWARSWAAWVGAVLLAVPWQFAEALFAGASAVHAVAISPSATIAEVAWKALAAQEPPSAATWFTHGLTYAGIAVSLLGAIGLVSGIKATGLRQEVTVT